MFCTFQTISAPQVEVPVLNYVTVICAQNNMKFVYAEPLGFAPVSAKKPRSVLEG